MAYSGKLAASNHQDLFVQLKTFLTDTPAVPGRDWTVVKSGEFEYGPYVVLKNTGTNNNDNIWIGLYSATKDSTNGGMVCKVYSYFDENMDFFDTQYGNLAGCYSRSDNSSKTHAFTPYWNNIVNFWIWSNKNRIIFVVNSNGMYSNAYLGKLKNSTFVPFNLVCLTDSYTSLWDSTLFHTQGLTGNSYDIRHTLVRQFTGNKYVGSVDKTQNHACHSLCLSNRSWVTHFCCAPYSIPDKEFTESDYSDNISFSSAFEYTSLHSSVKILLPMYVMIMSINARNYNETHSTAGLLDGVYFCPDAQNISESIVNDCVVFPDINRITWNSFMAIGDN